MCLRACVQKKAKKSRAHQNRRVCECVARGAAAQHDGAQTWRRRCTLKRSCAGLLQATKRGGERENTQAQTTSTSLGGTCGVCTPSLEERSCARLAGGLDFPPPPLSPSAVLTLHHTNASHPTRALLESPPPASPNVSPRIRGLERVVLSLVFTAPFFDSCYTYTQLPHLHIFLPNANNPSPSGGRGTKN
jgi:hypothetical protein